VSSSFFSAAVPRHPVLASTDRGLERLEGMSNDSETITKVSVSRAGGRSRSMKKQEKNNGPGFPSWLIGLVLVCLLSLKLTSSGSFMFYESSVYESRVYTSDGKVETTRKESVRSNVQDPKLLLDEQRRMVESRMDDFFF
jgi:hypothetical protein